MSAKDLAQSQKAFVLHVKSHTDREPNIEKIKASLPGFDVSLVLEGDIPDLTESDLDLYFRNGIVSMHNADARTSCAFKHLTACQNILDQNLDGALILEDDAVLYDNFVKLYADSLEECSRRYDGQPAIISFEDSGLVFVPLSERVRGQILYPHTEHRFAGCYYINNLGAKALLSLATSEKTDTPIDHTYKICAQRGLLLYLWTHPTGATQGSHNGMLPSSISVRRSTLSRIRWYIKLYYKKFLYLLR